MRLNPSRTILPQRSTRCPLPASSFLLSDPLPEGVKKNDLTLPVGG
jgi:hypothetical protein